MEVLTKAHDVAVLKTNESLGETLLVNIEASKEATDTHTVCRLALTKRDEVLKSLWTKELADINAKLEVTLRTELKTAKNRVGSS